MYEKGKKYQYRVLYPIKLFLTGKGEANIKDKQINWRNNTRNKPRALDITDPGFIPSTTYGSCARPGVIPGIDPVVSPEHHCVQPQKNSRDTVLCKL